MTVTIPILLLWLLASPASPSPADARDVVGTVADSAAQGTLYATIYRNVKTDRWNPQDQVLTGLAVSDDRGKSWRSVGVRNAGVFDFHVDRENRSRLLLACTTGLERSSDGGAHWKLVSPWYAAPVTQIRRLPGATERYLAGTCDGAFIFDAETEAWQEASAGLNTPGERHINTLIAAGDTLTAATEEGIFRSTDRAGSWKKIALGGMAVRSLARHPARPDLWAAATARSGVFVSTDGGATFPTAGAGLMSPQTFCIVFDPGDAQTLYCSSPGYGVYQSTDLGRNWHLRSRGLTNFTVTALAVDPRDSRVVYAGTKSGSFITTDKGERWNSFSLTTTHVTSLRFE